MMLARSILFALWMYGLMAVMGIACLPTLLLPRRVPLACMALWRRLVLAGLRILCGIVAAWFMGTGVALAQANAIESFDATQTGGNVIVRITTKEPLKTPPPSFTVANPARIVFDFANTANGLGRNAQEIGQGELRSMNVVQGSDRTRLVLNLRRSVGHEVTVDGKTIVVTISAAAAAPSGSCLRRRE